MIQTTAAEAAQRAVSWAMAAEDADRAATERRHEGDKALRQRGSRPESYVGPYSRAEYWAGVRDKNVALSNMWANVASVLHLVEDGELK